MVTRRLKVAKAESIRKIFKHKLMKYSPLVLVMAMLTLFGAGEVNAACRVITPGGSGSKTGADWNNALAGIPGNFVRGDSYYFATGNYGALNVSTPDSGTTVITLKKARQADHCTDTGYSDSAMGQGQAVFTHLEPSTDYWVFDGADSKTSTSGHGFYVDGTKCTINSCWDIYVNSVSNITVKYTAVQGMGDSAADIHIDENVRCMSSTNFSLLYSFVYNSSDVPVLTRGCNGFVMDHTTLYHNRVTVTNHGEGLSDGGSSGVTVSNSTFWDIEGTAAITELNSGTASKADNWSIFGNLFYYSPNNANNRLGYGDGVIAAINNQEASNWNIYNNTFANITAAMTLNMRVSFSQSTGSARNIYNNLWWNCAIANHAGTISADYNTYLNTDPQTSDSGSHSVIKTQGATDPFASDQTGNYQLTAATTAGTNSISGISLNVTDPQGNVRGLGGNWSRGAFQFVSGSVQATNPPTGLQAAVN